MILKFIYLKYQQTNNHLDRTEFIKRYGDKLWHEHYRYQEHRYLKYREAPKTPFDKYIYGNHPEVVKERDSYGHDSREVEVDRRRGENRYYNVQERRAEYYDGHLPRHLPRHKSQDDRKLRGRSRTKDDLYWIVTVYYKKIIKFV